MPPPTPAVAEMLAEKRLPPPPIVAQPDRLVATEPELRGGGIRTDPIEAAEPAVPRRSAAIGSRTIAIASCIPGPFDSEGAAAPL